MAALPTAGRAGLTAPLLSSERERMLGLQNEVLSLTSKLKSLEEKLEELEAERAEPGTSSVPGLQPSRSARCIDEDSDDDDDDAAPRVVPRSWLTKNKSWLKSHFDLGSVEDSEEESLKPHRVRRPDEDLFITVLSLFEHLLVPGWSAASIDSQGVLDLHGGALARLVPFMAMFLSVPVYCVLPLVGLRYFFMCGKKIRCRDRLEGLFRTCLMGWLAWVPLLYIIFGDFSREIRDHETTLYAVVISWWALAWFAYNIANRSLISACDSVVDNLKVRSMTLGSSQGLGFSRVLEALCTPDDPFSLYPMFVRDAKEEAFRERVGAFNRAPGLILVSIQVYCAVHPLLVSKCGFWPTLINLTGALGVCYGGMVFCMRLVHEIKDFVACVDEVKVFLFISSPKELRRSQRQRQEFLQLLQLNVKNRLRVSSTNDGKKVAAPGKEVVNLLAECLAENRENSEITKDLPLVLRRIHLDLSTLDGVDIFDRLQGWVCADVVNERFSIDSAVTVLMVTVVGLLMVAFLPSIWIHGFSKKVTLTEAVAVLDIAAILFYVLYVCNLCVEMNDLIFERTDRVLLSWKDHARSPNRTYLKVWLQEMVTYDTKRGIASGQQVGHVVNLHNHLLHGAMEVRANIDNARESLLLQEPQKILGMKVTPALRAKLVSTVGAAMATLTISLAKKLFGNQ